jgi:flagellar motor switch protein FliG
MRPFEFLRRTPPEQIVNFLHNESPQTVALVIANLHTALSAQVLANLPEAEQADIALRVARMGETSPDVVKQVEDVIRQKAASVVQQEYSVAGGVKSLADILNQADRSTERNVLDSLSETDEELAAEVRRLLFVFEDLVKLDDRGIQLVLREADQKDLALALRGVSDEVKDRILANMSERGAQMLVEEMEYQPPQRKRVVEEAQGRIVGIVRKLEDAGALVLSRGEADDVL